MASTQGKKITLKGGCHCGFITYTARTTLTPSGNLSATRCNCTFCQNLGYTSLHLTTSSPSSSSSPSPSTTSSNFTLHTPTSLSSPQLGDYAPRVKSVHRYFCRSCGSHVWMQGEYPVGEGKMLPVLAVNLGTVDVEGLLREEGVDLRRTEMGYFDMLHGNVQGGLRVEGPWEGGLV